MEKVPTKTARDLLSVIALKKGESVTAIYLIPYRVENIIDAQRKPSDRNTRLTAKEDILIVAENWDEANRRAKHVRFARRDRRAEGAAGLDFVKPDLRSRLRRALNALKVRPQIARGGFSNAIVFDDEISVPDSFDTGARGWIILRKDAGDILKTLPPLENSGRILAVWIEKVGFWGTPRELALRFLEEDPTNLEPLTFESPSGPSSEGRTIYRIGYDSNSRLISGIWESGVPIRTMSFEIKGRQISLRVGQRLHGAVIDAAKGDKE